MQSEVDLSFASKSSNLAKLKDLKLNESFLKLPDGVNISNLTHLTLIGNECIKKCLEQFTKSLTSLKTLRLKFELTTNFEDTYPLIAKHLPEEVFLDTMDIDLSAKGKSYYLTPLLEQLAKFSKESRVVVNAISIDAYVAGL